MALRHLASFLALPFTVAAVLPWYLLRNATIDWSSRSPAWMTGTTIVLITGFTLFASSLYEFVTRGHGTLAPWDPPRELVVRGPYRFVRNPMITGVIIVLIGEALLFRSREVLQWAAIFTAMNFVYIPLLEEPFLVQRFGDAYREYCRNVPRLIPRFSPWTPRS